MVEEYQRLAAVLAACGAVDTNRLHKLVHLFQTVGGPFSYNFVMGSSGVYSEDLQDDLRLLMRLGLIEERRDETETRLVPTSRANAYLGKAEDVQKRRDDLQQMMAVTNDVLDFATTLGVWLGMGYRFHDALNRTRESWGRGGEAAAVGFLKRHGLASA